MHLSSEGWWPPRTVGRLPGAGSLWNLSVSCRTWLRPCSEPPVPLCEDPSSPEGACDSFKQLTGLHHSPALCP